MKIGDPLDRSTSHGPQNHRSHLEKLLEYVEVGVKEGAKCVYGGKQVDRPGRMIEIKHYNGINKYWVSQKKVYSSKFGRIQKWSSVMT